MIAPRLFAMQEMIIEYPYERVKFSAEVRSQASRVAFKARQSGRWSDSVAQYLMAAAKSRLGTYATYVSVDRYVQEDMGDRHIPGTRLIRPKGCGSHLIGNIWSHKS